MRVTHLGTALEQESRNPSGMSTGLGTNSENLQGCRRRTKGKAPRPPADVRSSVGSSTFDLESAMMEQKENLDRDIQLTVVLPNDVTTSTSVNGSKPMMDLLIFLCAQYHLNPSAYTIDVVSEERSQVKFKPNMPVGMLDVEKVILKPKNLDEKNKKPTPVIPEQTVRVVINYKKTQKTVLRASPNVSLQELIPTISSKCELDPLHTVLLKDRQSQEPLELTKSLNDLGLRELYAADASRASSAAELNLSSSQESFQIPQNTDMQKQKEDDKGFFRFLRRSKKKNEPVASAPATPLLTNQRPATVTKPSKVFKPYESNTLPTEMPKKRRAPLPPMYASQTVPKDFVQGHSRPQSCVVKSASIDGEQKDLSGKGVVRTGSLQLSGSSSNESTLRRAKRKAPPPPSPTAQPPHDQTDENSNDAEPSPRKSPAEDRHSEVTTVAGGAVFDYSLEGIDEKEESNTYLKANEATMPETSAVADAAPSAEPQSSTGKGDIAINSQGITPVSLKSSEEKQEALNADLTQSKPEGTDTEEIMLEKKETLTLESDTNQAISEDNLHTTVEEGENGNISISNELSVKSVAEDFRSPDDRRDDDIDSRMQKAHSHLITNQNNSGNSTSTSGVKTQDASIQTASHELNDNGQIAPEEFTSDILKEKDNLKCMLNNKVSKGHEVSTLQEHSNGHTHEEKGTQSPYNSPSKIHGLYRQTTEPKPKPSNEITREYIPKIGMTTYTIVPQKSVDKLKFFESQSDSNFEYDAQSQVLEAPQSPAKSNMPYLQGQGPTASDINDANAAYRSKLCTSASQTDSRAVANNVAVLPISKKDVTVASPEKKGKQDDVFPKARTNSFYSQLQRRVSGQYVTSAVAKSATSPTSPIQKEPLVKETEQNVPLSPESIVAAPNGMLHSSSELIQPKTDINHNSKSENITIKPPLIAPKPFSFSSNPSKPLLRLRTFTAPKSYSTTAPSPFARAVSSAVKRSQSFSKTHTSTTSQPLKEDSTNALSPATSPSEVPSYSSESILESSRTLEQKMNLTNTEKNNNAHNPPHALEKKPALSCPNPDPEQIHQSLLAAIRSGEAAASLKRVTVKPNTISINGRSGWSHPVHTDVPYKQ
ncbi:cordon-bleu protein-like 1 isoform X2 [Pleurodeles waltl]|uniref:cordon-bleu protein-like 1 isoform X2 n=1 Tax=Pleurodeles waltl TaxID=8319 RepID=UPI0037096CAF